MPYLTGVPEGEHPPEAVRLHQEHPRSDDAAGGMGGKVTEADVQASSAAIMSSACSEPKWHRRSGFALKP